MNYKNPLKLAVSGCHYALSWQWQGTWKRKMAETFGALWLWEFFQLHFQWLQTDYGERCCANGWVMRIFKFYPQKLSLQWVKDLQDRSPRPNCQLWVWLLEGQVCGFAPTLYGSLKAPFAMAQTRSLILFNLTLYFEHIKYEESVSVILDIHIQITS